MAGATSDYTVDFGGEGQTILLLHGLMGCARTWWGCAQWLRHYGRVIAVDARAHGWNPHGDACRTEVFVNDLAEVLGNRSAIVIGHSMGGLHGLGLAATHPELVRALVVEDMAVDQRGRTVESWRPLFEDWPSVFESLAHVRQFFGEAGEYFVECMVERVDGYHLRADLDTLFEIAAEWGEREYWSYVDSVECPTLLLEAENSLMPRGQMAAMASRAKDAQHVVAPGAQHLIHDSAPEFYRGAVEAFLSAVS